MTPHRFPLEFHAAPKLRDPATPLYVEYEAVPYSPRAGHDPQPVLAGRHLLRPLVDLNDYRCRACLDWIEFELTMAADHQATNIQRFASTALRERDAPAKVYVSGPEGEKRYTGNRFRLRVQDPRPEHLAALVNDLHRKYAAMPADALQTRVLGVEVSIDFFVINAAQMTRDHRDLLRWRCLDLLRRHLRLDPVVTETEEGAPRYFAVRDGTGHAQRLIEWGPGSTRISAQLKSLGLDPGLGRHFVSSSHFQPPIDSTMYIGARKFPVQLRLMDKQTDHRNPEDGSALPLPESGWRARLEVSLPETPGWESAAAPLGLATIGDLYSFDYKRARRLFFEFYLATIAPGEDFRHLPFEPSIDELAAFGTTGVYGLDQLHRATLEVCRARRDRKPTSIALPRLGKKGRLVSYVDLNQKVDRALRALSSTWTLDSKSG